MHSELYFHSANNQNNEIHKRVIGTNRRSPRGDRRWRRCLHCGNEMTAREKFSQEPVSLSAATICLRLRITHVTGSVASRQAEVGLEE